MHQHRIATRDEWLAARQALLAEEREVTHRLDRLRAARRALPWVEVTEPYRFDAPGGDVGLADLFGTRSQLAVYHFMLPPEGDHICEGCAFLADHVDAARAHFEQADLSFAAVSRAPLPRIEAVRRRFGWRFTWVSAGLSRFNHDFGTAFTPAEIAAGVPLYNYGTSSHLHPDLHGVSIFARDEAGRVFHTYSAYARGAEQLLGAFNWLDLAPKGRNEDGTMSWVRLRDTYGAPSSAGCCAAE
jgi:predicted dithiol-disulfide oxidoreductase (DUF899 family)